MRLTGMFQQLDEGAQGPAVEVTKLITATTSHVVREPIDDRAAHGRYRDLDHSPTLGTPPSTHEAPPLELVEHPRHVRGPRDEFRPERRGRQRTRLHRSKHTEGVVLLRAESMTREDTLFEFPQTVIGPPELEIGLLLERVEQPSPRRATSGNAWFST